MFSNCVRRILVVCSFAVSVALALPAAAMVWSDAAVLNTNAASDGNVFDKSPQVAHDGQGNWVVVWHAANTSLQPRDFDILVSRSSDDGATWSAPAVLDPLGADPLEVEDDFRPWVYTDRNGHWIAAWYTWDSRGGTLGDDVDLLVSRSADNGATWTPSIPLNSDATTDHLSYAFSSDNISPNLAYGGNDQWVAVWSTVRSNTSAEDDPDIYVTRSSDHGATWSPMELLHADLAVDLGSDTSPRVEADTTGNWVVTWRSDNLIGSNGIDDRDIHVSRSTDGGVTWSAPAALNTDADTDGLLDVHSGGHDLLTDGTLWVSVWVRNLPPLLDPDLMISRSTNAGVTWSPPENLNPDYDVDAGYRDIFPRLATDGQGSWVVVWEGYNAGVFPWGADHDVLFMRSDDGALTWSQPAPVNSHALIDLTGNDITPTVGVTPQGRWLSIWSSNHNLGGTIGFEDDIMYATSCVPTHNGDHECDGDADLYDYSAFQKCFAPTGPVASECALFDFDGDDNVDLDDYAVFEGSLSGPGE